MPSKSTPMAFNSKCFGPGHLSYDIHTIRHALSPSNSLACSFGFVPGWGILIWLSYDGGTFDLNHSILIIWWWKVMSRIVLLAIKLIKEVYNVFLEWLKKLPRNEKPWVRLRSFGWNSSQIYDHWHERKKQLSAHNAPVQFMPTVNISMF